jgi:DNA-binding CsgD family transcriptional regulator
VDKSLVVAEAGPEGALRYRMLEPVRQYARERLEEGGEADASRRRHATFFLALAEEAEPHTMGPEQGAWLERLQREHDNLRAALFWTLDPEAAGAQGRAELGLRLATTLAQGRFWNAYGPGEERRWLERALARGSASPSPARAKALNLAGLSAMWQGDYRRSAALLEEGMTVFKELGDELGAANSLVDLGQMALRGGDRERVAALRQEAEALRPALEDRQALGFLLIFLGGAATDEGDRDRALGLLEEGLALHWEIGDELGIALCLTGLGVIALERGEAERAAALYEEDLNVLRRLRDKTVTTYGLRGTACVAALRGQPARAARLWGTVEALQEAIGLPLSPFDRAHPNYGGLLAPARSRLGEAAWEAAWAEGRAMTPEEAIEYALKSEESAPSPKEISGLSERELEVLRLVAEGLTDAQVASRLYLSPRTVGFHLRSIYRKLGVPSRAAAARAAVERSLI